MRDANSRNATSHLREARPQGTRGPGRAIGLPGDGRIPWPSCFIVELAGNKHQTVPRNAWFADVHHVP